MIRCFDRLSKQNFSASEDISLFEWARLHFNHLTERCPTCRTLGKLYSFGSYRRNLVSIVDGTVIVTQLRIQRYICHTCHKTHALLPDVIVPHSVYSLRFMLTAILAYYHRTGTVAEVCERLGIAISTLYSWIKRLRTQLSLLHGKLLAKSYSVNLAIEELLGGSGLTSMLISFFARFAFSFMQRHRVATTQSHPP